MKKLLVNLILFYQKKISRRTAPRCRFFPTCSNYAIEAIERFGVVKGGFLSFYRLLRCNPFSRGGCDPVPGGTKR